MNTVRPPEDAPFARARAVADAVLFEGYVLYPYRASAPKNRLRWQFGVVAPARWTEAQGGDPSVLQVTLLVDAEDAAKVTGQLRFLQLRRRRVERLISTAEANTSYTEVPALELEQRLYLPWDEGELCELPLSAGVPSEGPDDSVTVPFTLPGRVACDPLCRADGAIVGRIVRDTLPLSGAVVIDSKRLSERLCRVDVRIENRSDPEVDFATAAVPRDEAMRSALLGTHLLLDVHGGRFLSLMDPPDWAAPVARTVSNRALYPVLVEEAPGQDVVLAAPFILHDHPRVAPESNGDFYDAAEIDELLTLRTLTLTDDEKREVRATDPRAAAILARVENADADTLARLHGAFRDPATAEAPGKLQPGARVRLRPGPRRTDAQDMFLDGLTATVEAIMNDVDGRTCLAVTIDDDPGRDVHRDRGRFHYFYPDEVETT